MRKSPQAAAGARLSPSAPQVRTRWWIRNAPHPDTPHARDRAGAQIGLLFAIVAASGFWLAVVTGLIALARHG